MVHSFSLSSSLFSLSYSVSSLSLFSLPSLSPPRVGIFPLFTFSPGPSAPRRRRSTRALASFFTPSVFPALSRHPSHPLFPPPSTPDSTEEDGAAEKRGGWKVVEAERGVWCTRNAWLATLLDAPDESVRPEGGWRRCTGDAHPVLRPLPRNDGARKGRMRDSGGMGRSGNEKKRRRAQRDIARQIRPGKRQPREKKGAIFACVAPTPIPRYQPRPPTRGLTPRLASRRRKATSFDQLQPPVFPFVACLFVFFHFLSLSLSLSFSCCLCFLSFFFLVSFFLPVV